MSIELNKYKYIECIIIYHMMLTRKQKFSEFLEDCSCSSLYTSEEISEMIALYTSPCPSVSGALSKKLYGSFIARLVCMSMRSTCPLDAKSELRMGLVTVLFRDFLDF